jgi:uroporphyrinogen-III synthase
LRLLVTRPSPDAEATAGGLRALGHQAIVAPLLRIVFSPPPLDPAAPGALLMTSRNGVRAVAGWPQSRLWQALPVFVTGGKTAEEAKRVGFRDVHYGKGDVDDLAGLIESRLSKGDRPILYAAARDRSDTLTARLTASGYDLHVVEAYRAEPATRLADDVRLRFASRAIDGVLLYSRRTAETFRDLAVREGFADRLAGVTLYALSRQVAEGLAGLRSGAVRIAAEPSEDSLIGLIPPAQSPPGPP